MLDTTMRRLIDPPLNAAAAAIGTKISANQITIGGFLLGLVCCYAVAQGMFAAALIFLLLNRLADGLDGAVARQTAPSALGAYVDIVSDFLLWALLPLAFFVLRYEKCICGRHFVVELCHVDDGVSRLRHSGRKAWADQRGARQKKHVLPRRFGRGHGDHCLFHLHHALPRRLCPRRLLFAAFVYLSVIGRLMVSVRTLLGR